MTSLEKRLTALEDASISPNESNFGLTRTKYMRDGRMKYQLNEIGKLPQDITEDEFARLEPTARHVTNRRIVHRPGDEISFMDDDEPFRREGGENNG